MGLKTNKATKTSRLDCQYVGSFSVSNGDTKLTIAEQKKYVDEKLKSCKKNLLAGTPVFLEVSPDGIKVLASDEKTVKMGHSLRRVSYATAETSNKIFAYVSQQPGTDMEVVCHAFLAKKKDHAEGLSAALGKLFKQAFAYTLKRRDKLEEAVKKRGGNRRWAKQQVGEGHGTNVAGNPGQRSVEADKPRKETGVSSSEESTPLVRYNVPSSSEAYRPSPRTEQVEKLPPDLPQRTTPPAVSNQPESSSSSFSSRTNQLNEARPPYLPINQTTLPASSNQPRSPQTTSPTFPARTNQLNEAPPRLPKQTNLPARSGGPSSPDSDHFFFPARSKPGEEDPRPCLLPERNSSFDVGLSYLQNQPSMAEALSPSQDDRVYRKHSAPPDLMPTSPSHYPRARPRRSSDYTEEVSPAWISTQSWDFKLAANALLAAAAETPPPLPQRRGAKTNTITEEVMSGDVADGVGDGDGVGAGSVGDGVGGVGAADGASGVGDGVSVGEGDDDDDGGELQRGALTEEPRISLTLEDEDWYIPGVSREMVTELLETSDIGTFFVRDSQSCPGCYALTMKVLKGPNNPTGFANYLIVPEQDGFALQGFEKRFEDISTLIRHHASQEDGLPCRLVLAGSNPLFHDANGYLAEFMDEEEDRYSSLSNCTSMAQELEINGNVPW